MKHQITKLQVNMQRKVFLTVKVNKINKKTLNFSVLYFIFYLFDLFPSELLLSNAGLRLNQTKQKLVI
jgi:hypothetical protein